MHESVMKLTVDEVGEGKRQVGLRTRTDQRDPNLPPWSASVGLLYRASSLFIPRRQNQTLILKSCLYVLLVR
jgi:hypothetical protein